MALELNSIRELGGDKTDLELLKDLDRDDDDKEILDDFDKDFDADPINRVQLKEFIKELGIRKYRESENEGKEKEKKKKLKEMPVKDEQEATKPEDIPEKTKKKKKKNKIQHNEVSSTSTPVPGKYPDILAHINKYQTRSYMLVKQGQRWFDEELSKQTSQSDMKPGLDVEHQMETFASKLLEDEVSVYNKQREKSKKSEVGWLKTVLSSGTLTDKMAALTVLVQESPVHNLNSLENLINMVKKKGRRESMMATDTVKELFLSYLLPDRKLRLFPQNPLASVMHMSSGNKDIVDKRLILWYYEEQLKTKYTTYIQAVDALSHDTLSATKQKALRAMFELLVSKPEQEKTLLSMLVNKVGDPDYKLASKASHYLTRLVDKHPNMKTVVTEEVERLLYRPNVPTKAQYYCVCFLNQLLLSQRERKLASRLITVYFTYFKAFVKKGEVESKMMSALLTGVNRAYPYAKVDREYISEQMDTLYKIVHIVNFNTSVQALMLLYQVMDSSETVSDRYYTALYRKMADPALKSSSKQAIFLNLLFKSMRKDLSERRIKAFIKRLLQICSYQTPHFTCGALVLLGEVLKAKPNLILTKHKAEAESDDEEEHFTDVLDPDDKTEMPPSDSEGDNEDQRETTSAESSWVHKTNLEGGHDVKTYDAYHRNPLYCHADSECIWELEKMAHHFHPSVSYFAKSVLKGEPISYSGDPLQDFTTIRFLDRFVYKNPKKKENLPTLSSTLTKSHYKSSRAKGIKRIPVNSEKYLAKGEESIPVEEKFFYKYFTQKAEREKKDKEVRLSDEESDADSVSDSEFDAYLDKFENEFGRDEIPFDDDNMDFAGAFGKKTWKKSKNAAESGSDEESDDDIDDDGEDDDLSDEDIDFGEDFDENFKTFDDDDVDIDEKVGFDEEEISFSDDDHLIGSTSKGGKKRKSKDFTGENVKGKKKKHDGGLGLFAAAEEFSHLIDENTGSKFNMIGINALSNKDKADVKQLKWEVDRDHKIRGQRWKNKKSFKSNKSSVKMKGKGKKVTKFSKKK